MSQVPTQPTWLRIRRALGELAVAAGIKSRKIPPVAGFDPEKGLGVNVAVYFPDGPTKLYQLIQWLPVFENHPDDLTFGLVLRSRMAYDAIRPMTKLPIALVPTFAQLQSLYQNSPFAAVVYVNNGVANFQSLLVPELVHVHVNHGESDKLCMVSNQVKAYDRVFVAGEAAVLRHRAALAEFNEQLLIRVGRPQLDVHRDPALPESPRKTVLYAPTWEGEDEANNYTSMETMGAAIIEAAFAQPDVRVLYKPHPRIPLSEDSRITAQHNAILARFAKAKRDDSTAGHDVLTSADILAVFPRVDLLITDVSSVGLDFLYLRPEKPMILTNRRDDPQWLRREAPISAATPVITPSNIHQAASVIAETLANDKFAERRAVLRSFYFDNVHAGESTPRFFRELTRAIAEHKSDVERANELAARGTGPSFEVDA